MLVRPTPAMLDPSARRAWSMVPIHVDARVDTLGLNATMTSTNATKVFTHFYIALCQSVFFLTQDAFMTLFFSSLKYRLALRTWRYLREHAWLLSL